MKQNRTVAIIQARMGSSRLPGKSMMPIIDGKGPVELMLERVRRCASLDTIIVATTDAAKDDPLEALCERLETACFRGSEDDVLDRFYRAALSMGPECAFVRLTGDCPLHDPGVIDEVVRQFLQSGADYAANVDPPTFPDGLDTEVFTFQALEEAWRVARARADREHVTPFIRRHDDLFQRINTTRQTDLSHCRWTLDEEADLAFVKAVFEELYHDDPSFDMEAILALLKRRPDIAALNRGIPRAKLDAYCL